MKSSFTINRIIPVLFLMGILLNFGAVAQQTKKISLQGFLKDANGKAVADGQQEITFKLYTVSTGGAAEWTDTQNINVFGGVYSTHLGSTTNPLDNLNWGANTYYVGVTVQGTELTPRTELTFAPYSLGSPKAQEVVCSGAVGDIKHSILDPVQFAAVNGNCWVPMDGRNIAGSKLATILNRTTVPDGGGLFIRSQEFPNSTNFDDDRTSSSPIASFQGENLKSHAHSATLSVSASGGTSADGQHSHSWTLHSDGGNGGAGQVTGRTHVEGGNWQVRNTSTDGNHSHSVSVSGSASGNTNNSGGSETRPDNLNFWVYIRIN